MKLNHILFSAAACMALGSAALTSCSESFLDENQINAYDTDYFKTQEGIDDLVNGAYLMLKTKFNYQWGYLVYAKERMSLQMATIQLHTITTTDQTLNSVKPPESSPFGTTCMVLSNRQLDYSKCTGIL